MSSQTALSADDRATTMLRDRWEEHAEQWISWVRDPGQPDSYERFHRKHFLPLVPDPGRLTLEIGCGEGRVGRDLQRAGHMVVGVDFSPTMCQAAATDPETPIPVIAGDARKLPLADASVDCAIAFMCLQTIDDMDGAITEIARVLADEKKLALAIVHPIYSAGGFSPVGDSCVNFVIEQSYFESRIRVSDGGQDGRKAPLYRKHHPLQAYTEALLTAGFTSSS